MLPFCRRFSVSLKSILIPIGVLSCCVSVANAGGGGIVTDKNACIVSIDFYTLHLTAYQPETNANKEFCRELPEAVETIFTLDYLHQSLKDVPVDFRIIKDTLGRGKSARWQDIQHAGDIDTNTIYYHPPEIRPDGAYQLRATLPAKGDYYIVISAGHPTNNKTYIGLFPFTVGVSDYWSWLLYAVLAAVLVCVLKLALTAGLSSARQ